MMSTSTERIRPILVLALIVAGIGAGGCLGEPPIEDRWTRLDVVAANVDPGETLVSGAVQTINVRTAITYRRILTGFVVTELRASSTVSAASVEVYPGAPRVPMAQDIDRILANSVSVGRATRAVTGWTHLIQEVELGFDAVAPASPDGSGQPVHLFLLSYLGSGTEIERPDGSDSLIVTPFGSADYEILPVGMELTLGGGS